MGERLEWVEGTSILQDSDLWSISHSSDYETGASSITGISNAMFSGHISHKIIPSRDLNELQVLLLYSRSRGMQRVRSWFTESRFTERIKGLAPGKSCYGASYHLDDNVPEVQRVSREADVGV